jgi:glutaminase
VSADQFAVSVCTVDGQRFSMGDADVQFGVQSCSKPVSYCMALTAHGPEVVHSQIGREASGRSFNEMCLKELPEGRRSADHPDRHAIPHNPMINAGAIMSCSLIMPGEPLGERLEFAMDTWGKLCGSQVSFSGSMFLGERETADRNFCLGYMMKEANAFGEKADLNRDLELYFQTCSILCNSEQMAQLGATFAHGGTNPITGDVVFSADTTQKSLSLMLSCGMYDYSGEWAFAIGLPAKSGVGGCVFVVIPNFGGVAIWSPRLDEMGNSVRGVRFATELVKRFAFHHYDNLNGATQKIDPRRPHGATVQEVLMAMLFAASDGDLRQIISLLAGGADANLADYDGRTAMHLAASEGHTEVVSYLLAHGANHSPRDRWNGTPLGDAKRHDHAAVADLLVAANAQE